MEPASQLAYYRQQLALLLRVKDPGPDVAALRLNIREAIALLEEDLEPPKIAGSSKSSAQIAAAPTSCEIFDSLKEDKEKEDAVSSDDDMFSDESWDKKQIKDRIKREAEQKAAEAAAAAAALEKKKIKFCSAGNLNPADLKKEMNVQRHRRSVFKHKDDDEYRVSEEEKVQLQAALLEERKQEVLARVRRLESESGHGILGKYALEKEEAAKEEAAGGTWAELSDSEEEASGNGEQEAPQREELSTSGLICHVCQRKFKSAEQLASHCAMSQLHRQKVAEADAKAGEPPDSKPEMPAVARRKSRWDVGGSDEGDSNGQKRARDGGEGGEGGEGGGGSGLDGDPIGVGIDGEEMEEEDGCAAERGGQASAADACMRNAEGGDCAVEKERSVGEKGEKEGVDEDLDAFLYTERTWTKIYARPVALAGKKMLGAWEQHTRGVATNIMRRMGYVVGAGLGVDGEGIMNPLVAKTKNDKAGLGADPEGEGGMEEDEGDDGNGKRKRGGAKKWTSEKQKQRAMGDNLDKKKGWEAKDESGLVATMNSAVMSGYGRAMGRANIDAVTVKELPHALVHTREALMLAEKQKAKLAEAMERNKANQLMQKEITRKMEVVDKHMADLRADERLIQKRQDKATGKKFNGKGLF